MSVPLHPWIHGPLLAMGAGLLFFLTYRLNEQFDGWALYAQGINLIFLPAGIKHLAILIGGGWGALGCFLALLGLAREFWNDVAIGHITAYSAISTGATWLGLILGMRLLRIRRDLRNLQFIHLPMIDLITTALHGFTTNVFFISVGMKSDNLIGNALAMMFGDFVGSFVLLTLLWLSLMLVRQMRAKHTRRI